MNPVNRYMPLVDYDEIHASAPGRFVLIGEFADLYEKNAIAMTIDRRMNVVIRPYKEGRLRLNLKNYECIREWPTTSIGMNRLVNKFGDFIDYNERIPVKLNHLLHKRYYITTPPSEEDLVVDPQSNIIPVGKQADDATLCFLILYAALGDSFARSARPPLDIEIDSDIPIGLGMGASSAFAVALTAALMKVFRVSAEQYVIGNWATQIDRHFHKYSSGLSSSTIMHGGYCYYQHNKVKSYGVRHVNPIKVMFIDTGVARPARAIYEAVSNIASESSNRVNNVFINIGELAATAWRLLSQPKFHPRMISSQLLANQELLNSLGLDHEFIIDICERAHHFRLCVKQTHCGRTAIMLYDETDLDLLMHEFRQALKERDYKFIDVNISYNGLQVGKIMRPTS